MTRAGSISLAGWLLALGAGPGMWAQNAPAAPAPLKAQDSVTVTADRGLSGITDAASSQTTLAGDALMAPPALALDDDLHQVAGFQLFRRTSSWTANPTSQGVSLRGLGSTAASRTLVVSDQVPFNDPFGGWVHWNEIPLPAVVAVSLLRGGAADLYGSSAIGGVIQIVPALPAPADAAHGHAISLTADASGASEDAALADAVLTASSRRAALLAAASTLTTDGYIPTAPALRGTVDTPANVRSRSGRLELRTGTPDGDWDGFLRGNVLDEERANGTPDQTNSTRLWRFAAGGDLVSGRTQALVRVYGARETYAQSFSSIAANRNSETLTRLQRVPLDEAGLVVQSSRQFPHAVTAAAGFDVRDIRATDDETPTGVATTSISARQREAGGYADAIWQPARWSVSGSVRVDSFRTFDGQRVTAGAQTPEPQIAELVVSPRLGLVRRLGHGLTLTGTGFRAFRGPTLNELYRTSQVGSQTTLANPSLLAERATGLEFGAQTEGRAGRVELSYFWTEVNRPVSAVTFAQTATTQTLQRENLGQILSQGMSLQAESAAWHGVSGALGYQFADARVTRFTPPSPLQPNITGLQIPEVPRQSVNANGTARAPHLADIHLFAVYGGAMFDDSANQLLLHPYVRVDLSAERALRHGVTVFVAAQNVLNRQIQAGLTPTLTLAAPRLVQGGVRIRVGR